MKLKKVNAALGLLSIAAILLHMGYSVFTYLFFYYNPFLQKVFAIPFMVLVCLHAVCGMLIVFTQGDGTRMDMYPKQNLRTVFQRVSAALILPLLILHINTFALMSAAAKNGHPVYVVLLMIAELLFFAVVIMHVVTSFTRGFITLGWLSSIETQQKIDKAVYVIGAIVFAVSSFIILKGQIGMFLLG